MNDVEQHLCDELTTMVSEHGWEKTLTMLKQIAQGQAALIITTERAWRAKHDVDCLATQLHNAAVRARDVDARDRRLKGLT